MKTYFFEYQQNNSGGSFDVDDKLCHRVIIEAADKDHANEIDTSMGIYFNGVSMGYDCPCCGSRWHAPFNHMKSLEELSGSYKIMFNTMEEYAQYVADRDGWTTPDCRIFYLNGEVSEITSNKKQI